MSQRTGIAFTANRDRRGAAAPAAVVLAFVVLLAGLAVFGWTYMQAANKRSSQTAGTQPKMADLAAGVDMYIPPFELIDQDGRPFNSRSIERRWWVVGFIDTAASSDTHPSDLITTNLAAVQNQVEDREIASFLLITLNPEHDRPEVLKAYAGRFEFDPANWSFLTGEAETIHRLAREEFLLPAEKDGGPILEPGRVMLIGPTGHIMNWFLGADTDDLDKLAAELRSHAAERKGTAEEGGG